MSQTVRPLALVLLLAPITASWAAEPSLICFGNEPSWRLDLTETGKARFSTPDSSAVDYVGAASVLVWRKESVWRGQAVVPGGGELVAFLREGACSDGMSETEHSYSVNVSLPGGRHYAGCCRVPAAQAVSGSLENATWLLTTLPGQSLGFGTDVFQMSNEFFKEAARRSVEAGVDAMWVSEDLGDSTRGFLRLNQFRQYFLPYFNDLVDTIDSLGVPVLLHSCGHISEYLPDLVETKIAALHPLQRSAGMDLRTIKEQYGERLCIIGNIDSSYTLPFGTPEQVEAEVRAAIDMAAPGSGYVLGSDHSLHDGIPVENIVTMFRTGLEYGRRAVIDQPLG